MDLLLSDHFFIKIVPIVIDSTHQHVYSSSITLIATILKIIIITINATRAYGTNLATKDVHE